MRVNIFRRIARKGLIVLMKVSRTIHNAVGRQSIFDRKSRFVLVDICNDMRRIKACSYEDESLDARLLLFLAHVKAWVCQC